MDDWDLCPGLPSLGAFRNEADGEMSTGSASVCSGIALLDSGSLVCGVMDLLVLVFIL